MGRVISAGGRRADAAAPAPAPAPAASEVTSAGMLKTAQCQNLDPVGASGSKTESANDFVSAGAPDQLSCGETSAPPASAFQADCGSASPLAKSSLLSVRVSNTHSSVRAAYGSYDNRGDLLFRPQAITRPFHRQWPSRLRTVLRRVISWTAVKNPLVVKWH